MDNKPMILVVDDERDFTVTVRDRLEASGFETCVAHEGIRALEMAHKKKPDLIILDIRMPAGDGLTVLKTLREKEETRKIPVVILTGLDEEGLEEKVKKLGAALFLRKPFDLGSLVSRVSTLLPE
ncbi:MAG: response regulator [Deltaproteobacteria bacterium]|nr:response regulator [Deltaproteobacteria bacterium]